MFFVVAKLFDFFLVPSNALAIIGVLSLAALAAGYRRTAAAAWILTGALLILFGWSPLGVAALVALESRFPPPEIKGEVAGIILLGGAVETHIAYERGQVALTDAAERVTATAELARRFPAARIILSGGANHLVASNAETESSLARRVLVAMGLPAERIELEEKSRDTCENGTESRIQADPKPGEQWLLVTSASHMPRAIACFRVAGFSVIPYPVDYRTRGRADFARPASSIAVGLQDADLAAHEWIGLLAYRMTRTRELFPAP